MKKIILNVIVLALCNAAFAQWVSTNTSNNADLTSFAANESYYFAGTDGQGVLRSNGSGQNWESVINGFPDPPLVGIESVVVSGTNVFAAMPGYGVFMSTDNGNYWSEVNNGPASSNGLSDPFIYCLAVSGDYLFAGGNYGGMYRSGDNGNNWESINNGFTNQPPFAINSITCIAAGNDRICAGTDDNGVFLSIDNGNTWSAINNGLPSSASITALAMNSDRLFAALGEQGVYMSADNGINWIAINGALPNGFYVTALAADDVNVYAGLNQGGVYVNSGDFGTWSAFNEGIPNWGSGGTDIVLLTRHGSDLFAGIRYYGVWKYSLDATSGVSAEEFKPFEIYPNPVQNYFIVDTGDNTLIKLYDNVGREVISQRVNSRTSVNIGHCPSGVYYVRVFSDSGTVSSFRIVKQ